MTVLYNYSYTAYKSVKFTALHFSAASIGPGLDLCTYEVPDPGLSNIHPHIYLTSMAIWCV